MAERTKVEVVNKEQAASSEGAPWAHQLFTPERIQKWTGGEITLQELHAIAEREMLDMAVIGYSMYEQGRYEDAAVVFQGLCSLDPKEPYYQTALGVAYLAQEKLDSAQICFDRAIALNDREIASYVNRGEVHLRQGRVIEAANDFKRAVDLDPENKDPLSRRARLLAAAALATIDRAKAIVEKRGARGPVSKGTPS